MTDSGMGCGLSAPANERADTRLHSRADLVKRSAVLGGAVLATGGFVTCTCRVGVGKPSWPTPDAEFYVRNKLIDFASPMYGPVAFGTSARSEVRPTGPPAGTSGSTERTGRIFFPAASHMAASGCATETSSGSPGLCRWARP
jgi:hypothetical protein